MAEFSFQLRDQGENGEFLSWATVDYLEDGVVVGSEDFLGSMEFAPGYTGDQLAASAGHSWVEAMTYTLEERLGPYGLEYQREQYDRDNVPF